MLGRTTLYIVWGTGERVAFKFKDIAGKEFHRLTAQWPAGRCGTAPRIYWLCSCVCGNLTVVSYANLISENQKSCGCLAREHAANLGHRNVGEKSPAFKHGHGGSRIRGQSTSPTFRSWCAAITRCDNPNREHWKDYGGRGIKVCERWRGPQGFQNFLADMGERLPGTTLDRFPDNDGDYCKDNCRWATAKEQANNKQRRAVLKKAA
jgi:hypothetical protein